MAAFAAIGVLTSIILLLDGSKRIFGLLMDNDIPFLIILKMLALLLPQALTVTIPLGLLVAVLLVFGRMSYDQEIQIIRSSGLGLIPFIAPVVLFSIFMSLVCFYNNAMLAPTCMTTFKTMLVDMGRNNPTVLIRAQEPITKFNGFNLYVDKKYGNTVEGVYIWEIGPNGLPKRSMRADRGILNADLQDMTLTITLFNARQEERGADPTELDHIQSGMRAAQLPIRVPLGDMLDTSRVKTVNVMTFGELRSRIFSSNATGLNFTPLLTELQKRLAFPMACFTFVLVGIPLAITTGRKETSIGFVMGIAIFIFYYLMVVVAMALRETASAWPELIVWTPNLLFQAAGIWLLWRVNRHPL